MKYSELVDWLYRLSEQSTFKNEIRKFLKIREPYAIGLDQEKGIAFFEERTDSESTDYKKYSESFDEHIVTVATQNWSKTATMIHDEFPDRSLESIVDGWIEKLEIAQKLTETNQYYINFPNYLKTLQVTIDRLNEFKYRLLDSSNKRGNPNWKGLDLESKAIIIEHANKLLNENPEAYRARKGAYVSERLKVIVTDDLIDSIPDLTKNKVARVLQKYYANIKS